jgi:hypothetical protein
LGEYSLSSSSLLKRLKHFFKILLSLLELLVEIFQLINKFIINPLQFLVLCLEILDNVKVILLFFHQNHELLVKLLVFVLKIEKIFIEDEFLLVFPLEIGLVISQALILLLKHLHDFLNILNCLGEEFAPALNFFWVAVFGVDLVGFKKDPQLLRQNLQVTVLGVEVVYFLDLGFKFSLSQDKILLESDILTEKILEIHLSPEDLVSISSDVLCACSLKFQDLFG